MAPLNVKAENKPMPLKQPISLKSVYRPFAEFDLDLWSKCAKGNADLDLDSGFLYGFFSCMVLIGNI
jgi:hypothetical protein